jgi:hypothetical protein
MHILSHLDPVFVPPVEDILAVRVLEYQTFPSSLHNDFHTFTNILSGLALIFGHKLNAALLFCETSTEVAFAKLARLM